jgi:hypothetical protein
MGHRQAKLLWVGDRISPDFRLRLECTISESFDRFTLLSANLPAPLAIPLCCTLEGVAEVFAVLAIAIAF